MIVFTILFCIILVVGGIITGYKVAEDNTLRKIYGISPLKVWSRNYGTYGLPQNLKLQFQNNITVNIDDKAISRCAMAVTSENAPEPVGWLIYTTEKPKNIY